MIIISWTALAGVFALGFCIAAPLFYCVGRAELRSIRFARHVDAEVTALRQTMWGGKA
jgi:hypothetical protein